MRAVAHFHQPELSEFYQRGRNARKATHREMVTNRSAGKRVECSALALSQQTAGIGTRDSITVGKRELDGGK